MTTLISKYKIYGRKKGRKKKSLNLDQTFIKSIITKDINIKISCYEGIKYPSWYDYLTNYKMNYIDYFYIIISLSY